MSSLRRSVPRAPALAPWLALLGAFLLVSARPAFATHCDSCEVAVDSCCSAMPHIQDPGMPPITRGVVETREPDLFSPWPYSVTLYDITQNIPAENVNWNPITRYHGPGGSWNDVNLGTVFGLTLDKFGNIYVTHTSCYGTDIIGPGGPGAIYRIDNATGAITTFATLPNVADPNFTPPNDMPGLGNISYDCANNQFFVTNMEDGRIYRLKSNANNTIPATILNFFDPGAPDNGTPGWAPLTERLWGVQWHAGRVYYSVWSTDVCSAPNSNTIRSVGLDGSGDYVWWSDRLELVVPSHVNSPGISSPVSDISFGPTGKMLLAERTMCGPTFPSAHQSRVLEYACEPVPGGGPWLPAFTFKPGQIGTMDNAAGGVDYDFGTYDGPSPPATAPPGGLGGSSGRVWATSDAIHLGSPYTDVIYGLQAFRYTGGDITTSLLIDSDSNISTTDKTFIGDVEVPCPPPPTGRICGRKFLDSNRNGVRDSGEPPLAGWTITLSGPVSGTAVTDQTGSYCFNNLPAGTYTVCEVNQPNWVQTAPPGGCYTVTLPPDALNLDFGNARCLDVQCIRPPTKMTSWWPFDEPSGSLAHDIMGPNTGAWVGAPVVVPGQVSNALQFNGAGDYVTTPGGSLNFGNAAFSIDAWVKLTANDNSVRTIVDKRFQSGSMAAPQGYAFYVFNHKLGIQLGDGTTFQNVGWAAGPALVVGQWHHVAAVFDRAGNQVTMYVDGVSQTFGTAVAGSVSNPANFRIGQRHISPAIAFNGAIDEVEVFRKLLTSAEVNALFNAGSRGKCKKMCQVPTVSTYTGTQQTLNVCFNICNRDWSGPATFNWSLAGLPIGPGCTVSGPTVFSPSNGVVTVPAGGCVPICVTIQRPAGLTPGQTACFQLSVMDSAGGCFSCVGKLRASNIIQFPDPVGTALIALPSDGTTHAVDFTIANPTPAAQTYGYQVRPVPDDGDPENHAVRLDGLPPGVPVIGTLTVAPGGTGTVSVNGGYDPHLGIPLHQIVLEADMDGDGIYEEAAAIGVEPTEVSLVSAPEPGEAQTERALGYPNPFSQNTGVAFSMSKAQPVTVRVFDVNGRLVKNLRSGTLSAGRHYITWDGRDQKGQPTDSGIFFLRVETPDKTIHSKVVRMK